MFGFLVERLPPLLFHHTGLVRFHRLDLSLQLLKGYFGWNKFQKFLKFYRNINNSFSRIHEFFFWKKFELYRFVEILTLHYRVDYKVQIKTKKQLYPRLCTRFFFSKTFPTLVCCSTSFCRVTSCILLSSRASFAFGNLSKSFAALAALSRAVESNEYAIRVPAEKNIFY